MSDFRLEPVVEELKRRREIFVSEADFQLELAFLIREMYPEAKVRLEFCPVFDPSMHLDILVVLGGKWYPIELKYKTIACKKIIEDEAFYLKTQGARDIGCYLYLKDIQRIEQIRKNIPEFTRGYTMFITNDMGYTKMPGRENVLYAEFSLGDGALKTGKMMWKDGSSGWGNKMIDKPIVLEGKYEMKWREYSKIDDEKSGTFKYVLNEID